MAVGAATPGCGRWVWPGVLLAVALLGPACGEDPPTAPDTGSIEGVIVDVDSGAPVAGVRVQAVAPASLSAAGGAVLSDSQGRYSIAGLSPGAYAVFVYGCSKVVFDRTQPLPRVTAGDATTLDMRLITTGLWSCDGYQIEGTVVDSATNRAVSGAYVGPSLSFQPEVSPLLAGASVPYWGSRTPRGTSGSMASRRTPGPALATSPASCRSSSPGRDTSLSCWWGR